MYLSSRHREYLQEGLHLLQFCSDFWEQDSTLFSKRQVEIYGSVPVSMFCGICDMASLLRMTVSLEVAVDTIVDAALPMIIMNAIGMIVFISNFNGVFIFQDLESSRQIQKMSVLSQKCLPLLQDGGLNKAENMKKLSDIILNETQWSGILFTDREKVIQWQCRAKDEQAIFLSGKVWRSNSGNLQTGNGRRKTCQIQSNRLERKNGAIQRRITQSVRCHFG